MVKNDIVADIKIKEQKGSYYQDIDYYKNIEINKLILLLQLKYQDSWKTIIDKIFEKSKITNDKKQVVTELNKLVGEQKL